MSNLQTFTNPEFGEIRTVTIDGEAWFVGKDAATILGYANTRKAITDHVDNDDKMDGVTIRDSIGREQNPIFINESGLYSLILSSKLPNAKRFKKWVTSEVLPSVRKHGAYMTPETLQDAILNPDVLIQICQRLKDEQNKRRALELESVQQKQLLAEYEPKVTYYDVVLQTKDAISIRQIAKDYGKSAQWMNEFLHQRGVQYKQGKIWLLYQQHSDKGYTKSKTCTFEDGQGETHSQIHTYWTQKGRLFIYDLLKASGVLPLIEQEPVNKVA